MKSISKEGREKINSGEREGEREKGGYLQRKEEDWNRQ